MTCDLDVGLLELNPCFPVPDLLGGLDKGGAAGADNDGTSTTPGHRILHRRLWGGHIIRPLVLCASDVRLDKLVTGS